MPTQDFKGTINGVLPNQIIGDGTAGRVLRSVELVIQDATDANEIKVTSTNTWNGDAAAEQDNLGKGESTGDGKWSLDSGGIFLSFNNTAISGDCVTVVAAFLNFNNTGTAIFPYVYKYAGGIYVVIRNAATGANIDLTALVGVGTYLKIQVVYLTSA